MRTKKEIVGGITVVLLLSSIVVNSIYINKYVKLVEEQEQYKLQIQKHQQEAKQLTEELSNKSEMIEGLQQQINQLEAENKSLEGVQQTIISNVGYIPNEYERKLLEMLVECEAGGESMQGKIAVVNVVLNRIKSADFPNSISKVIYQKNQFEPVVTGIIDSKTPSQDSIEAVKRAFMGEKVVDSDIVNFWASWLDSSNDLWNHIEIVTTIGVHHFGRGWE
ncbi:cell wall hydrolase [uncultured Clostridium sp.]|uniref:cell wall hydrolase n=1 Tax=uncultured Clostridium sp. TaxID=59620 RepID=UPI0026F3B26A|nr:cell wall hydrolase [uncultured Clostridium sp.]